MTLEGHKKSLDNWDSARSSHTAKSESKKEIKISVSGKISPSKFIDLKRLDPCRPYKGEYSDRRD